MTASGKARISPEEMRRFLTRPESYPERPSAVETVETHFSLIFLTEHFAYKLKKPIQWHTVDLRKRAARRSNCREELRLNRRLAPGTYLGVVPVTAAGDSLQLGGTGVAIDWLVKMRRLPHELMLDHLIKTREPAGIELRPAVLLLCDFFTRRRPETPRPAEYRQRFLQELEACALVLREERKALSPAPVEQLVSTLRQFVESRAPLFDRRVEEGRIVEGHGDLRPEHICLTDPPVVFDCLEFQRDLRILDPVEELAFLALECERLGAPRVGQEVLSIYAEYTLDASGMALACFYKAFVALVRAKLAAWRTEDPGYQGLAHWIQRVTIYFEFAQHYAAKLSALPRDRRSSHRREGA